MEEVLLGTAAVALVLAFCSLAASGVIFVKADVPEAVRFLRHRAVPAARAAVGGMVPPHQQGNEPVPEYPKATHQEIRERPAASHDDHCFDQAVTMPIWLKSQREETECLN